LVSPIVIVVGLLSTGWSQAEGAPVWTAAPAGVRPSAVSNTTNPVIALRRTDAVVRMRAVDRGL
jgi:hypothetical protein